MGQRFLSFRTAEGDHVSEWSPAADALSRRLAAAVEASGYATDFEACRYAGMQDWEFLARGHGQEFVVVLVLCGFRPNRWFVTLNDTHCKQLESLAVEAVVHPVLEGAVREWPGASGLRWHADASSLREV